MQNVAFKAGETIIREGDEGDTAYFIVSGAVDVTIGHGAKARMVGRLETGEVFGEMCLIEPGPRSATITAASDTECLAASYQDFITSIEENPERAVGFMKTLVRRLRQMNELLECGSPGRPTPQPGSPPKQPPCPGRCYGDLPEDLSVVFCS
jgi:CRP/FNR family cyclic AMP-dependent transcriptional regulator